MWFGICPDDFLTLLLLAGHPQVNLKAVTITPSSPEQVGLVRTVLVDWFKLDIPIGVHNIQTTKPSVSQWHYDAYGAFPSSTDADTAVNILSSNCDEQTTLITGAALTNLAKTIKQSSDQPFLLERLVAQGGFAGEGVVPAHLQLEKFKGLTVCPTHNLILDRKATETVLNYTDIQRKLLVAKMFVTVFIMTR